MTFGQGQRNFLINSAFAVGQAVKTRLLLMTGEWFLDVTDGTPYATQILGTGTLNLYDAAIQARILGTQGVLNILQYSSELNQATRALAVQATISTIYSAAATGVPVLVAIPLIVPQPPPFLLSNQAGVPIITDQGVPILVP